jgi:hypothetical protein
MEPMVIISYSLAGRKNALELTRKIYGYKEFSNNSRYKYNRKGILSDVKYEKLSRGTILISKADEDKVVEGFVKLKLKIKVLTINILNRNN